MSDRIAREADEAVAERVEQRETEIEGVVTEEIEQKDAEGAKKVVEGPPAEPRNATEGIPSSAQLAERIARSSLPPGLRTRLAEVAAAGGGADQLVQAVEEALPGVMRLSDRDVSRPAHKAGEVFFRGDAEALSDERAEQMAREQLSRTGMLRGQRVRVAD